MLVSRYANKINIHSLGWIVEKFDLFVKYSKTCFILEGFYARFCIQVQLNKPVIIEFELGGKVQHVMYENLAFIYFKGGLIGQVKHKCNLYNEYVYNKESRK